MLQPRKAGKVAPLIYNPIHPLPSAFAQHILDVEMQFEETHTLVLLNTLLSLYSTAIEYYEALNDPKYHQFKERMHQLLKRKEVLRLIRPETTAPPPAPEPLEDLPKLNADKRYKSVPLREQPAEVTLAETRNIEGIVSESHQVVRSVVKNVQADISIQHDSLKQRLKDRKTRTLSRPTSPEFDQTANSYEKDLEEVLERHLIEKQTQIAAVRSQFEGQIAEIEALAAKSQNGLLRKVALEMKKSQESAQARVEAELFAKKQEDINALRRKWMK